MSIISKQLESIKTKYPKHLIFIKVLKSYESYGDDAEGISKITKIPTIMIKKDIKTLGFTEDKIDSILKILIKEGKKVAILQAS